MPRSVSGARRRALVLRVTAVALILIGFVDLARGGIVLAPVALVVGYLVLAPLAFLLD
jgi:hypothetical protein